MPTYCIVMEDDLKQSSNVKQLWQIQCLKIVSLGSCQEAKNRRKKKCCVNTDLTHFMQGVDLKFGFKFTME